MTQNATQVKKIGPYCRSQFSTLFLVLSEEGNKNPCTLLPKNRYVVRTNKQEEHIKRAWLHFLKNLINGQG